MYAKPLLLIPLLAALSGCTSVTLDELGGFGLLPPSATWFEIDGNFGEQHAIVISTEGNLCGRVQATVERCVELLEDLQNECDVEAAQEFFRNFEGLSPGGARYINISLFNNGDSEPDEETYEINQNPGFNLQLTRYEDNPFKIARETLDDDCLTDQGDVEDAVEGFFANDGELEITRADRDVVEGSIAVDLIAVEDGDDAGDLDANFSAGHCELEADGNEETICVQFAINNGAIFVGQGQAQPDPAQPEPAPVEPGPTPGS